jgi:PQQ-dependent catabolism-associated CXXCW motif protein
MLAVPVGQVTATPADSPGTPAAENTVAPEPEGFWTGPVNDPVPATIQGGKVIHTQQLAGLLKAKGNSVVVVDVSNAPRRPENLPASTTWLPLPHQGIPGAIWIPGAGFGEPPASIEEYYRERLATATGRDMGKPLVLYCHEKCWLSWNGARRAIQYGYRNVYWYPEGIEGWRKAKLATEVIQPEPVP